PAARPDCYRCQKNGAGQDFARRRGQRRAALLPEGAGLTGRRLPAENDVAKECVVYKHGCFSWLHLFLKSSLAIVPWIRDFTPYPLDLARSNMASIFGRSPNRTGAPVA